jgi:hypothetical protein
VRYRARHRARTSPTRLIRAHARTAGSDAGRGRPPRSAVSSSSARTGTKWIAERPWPNPKELPAVHLVEEFTVPSGRASVSRMKIDCEREFDDAADARQGSFAEGVTGTFESVLDNPVLPSEFDFFARGSRRTQSDVYLSATNKREGAA